MVSKPSLQVQENNEARRHPTRKRRSARTRGPALQPSTSSQLSYPAAHATTAPGAPSSAPSKPAATAGTVTPGRHAPPTAGHSPPATSAVRVPSAGLQRRKSRQPVQRLHDAGVIVLPESAAGVHVVRHARAAERCGCQFLHVSLLLVHTGLHASPAVAADVISLPVS